MNETLLIIASVLGATLRIAVPLVLCALAGAFSERAGIIDIGLEGKMLAAAFTAACLGAIGWPAPAALLAAMAVATALALVHAFACITPGSLAGPRHRPRWAAHTPKSADGAWPAPHPRSVTNIFVCRY